MGACALLIAVGTSALVPQQLLQFISPNKPLPAAEQLRDALVSGDADTVALAPLADECAAARVPFKAELLGDGELWRASSIVRGEVPRWERQREIAAISLQ